MTNPIARSSGQNGSFQIVPLPKENWKGTAIPMRYTTSEYYDLELTETGDAFQARMVKKPFDAPVTHTPEEYDFPDRLYQDHWEGAEAYGILSETGELLACIELCPEEWSNRLMVTELWVAAKTGEDYYLKMMAAWYFATALAKQYDVQRPGHRFLSEPGLPPHRLRRLLLREQRYCKT